MLRCLWICVFVCYYTKGSDACDAVACLQTVQSFTLSGATANQGRCTPQQKRLKAAALGCLRNYKAGSMNMAGCSQQVKQMLSTRAGMMIDSLSMFCSDCDLMSLGNRCQAKLAKQGVTLSVNAMTTCLRNEAKNVPSCNTPLAKAALEKLISIAKQQLGKGKGGRKRNIDDFEDLFSLLTY